MDLSTNAPTRPGTNRPASPPFTPGWSFVLLVAGGGSGLATFWVTETLRSGGQTARALAAAVICASICANLTLIGSRVLRRIAARRAT